ncbi:hypothetical protein ACWNT8_00600 [Pigmentibacter ruber]
MRINNFGIKITILILFFLLLSCKKSSSVNSFEIHEVTINNGKTFIDKERKIIIYNSSNKNADSFLINYKTNCDTKLLVNGKNIKINADLKEFIQNLKVNLKFECKNLDEKYTLYFSSIPVLKIKDKYIENFPKIIDNDLDLIDNGVSKSFKVKTNYRGADTLGNYKKSIAVYGDTEFSKYLYEKFKISSNINHYVLYASAYDPTMLKDLVGQKLFNSSIKNAKHHKIKGVYVELFIDNKYCGIYVLYNSLNTKILKNPPANKRHTIEFKHNDRSVFYKILINEDNMIENNSNFKFHKENLYSQEMGKLFMKCDKEIEDTIDKDYAYAVVSTVLFMEGYDNVTNNCFASLEKGTVKEFYKNGFKNDRVYFILWDLDLSFSGDPLSWGINGFSYFSQIPDDELKAYGSLFACLTNNTNGFKEKFIQYWKSNHNNIKDVMFKSLEQQFLYLKENNAYERELIFWNNLSDRKFDTNDFSNLKNWTEKRFEYLNKLFN